MNLAELLIKLVHVLFIVFFTVTPFLPFSLFPEVHILHFATGPLLFMHWLLNSDECCLTQLECAVTGKAKGRSSTRWSRRCTTNRRTATSGKLCGSSACSYGSLHA